MFSGGAGSGESNIRKWLIEKDMLEAIIAMPDQLFYNTGISTYIWIVTNRKQTDRKGKIQMINAVDFFENMRKSLGNKRHEISEEQIAEITKIYGSFRQGEKCKVGYEINFNKEFYKYEPLRSLEDIKKDILALENETKGLLDKVLE